MKKTRFIGIRIEEQLYKFMNSVVIELKKYDSNFSMSDLVRNIIYYFFMAYTLGEWNKTLPELRKEFKDFISSIHKSEQK